MENQKYVLPAEPDGLGSHWFEVEENHTKEYKVLKNGTLSMISAENSYQNQRKDQGKKGQGVIGFDIQDVSIAIAMVRIHAKVT